MISLFFHPQCPHCREQKKFIPYLQANYPELPWVSFDTSNPENSRLLAQKWSKAVFPQRTLSCR